MQPGTPAHTLTRPLGCPREHVWARPPDQIARDPAGQLRHHEGILDSEPGVYAVGRPYQRSITSHLLGGVGADAEHVVDHFTART